MCRRVRGRTAFGKTLAEQGVIQEWIADSRMEIDQARLLTLTPRGSWTPSATRARAGGVGDQGRRAQRRAASRRPGDPGSRRALVSRTTSPWRRCTRTPHAAVGRRSGRGAPHGDRPARAPEVRGGIEAGMRRFVAGVAIAGLLIAAGCGDDDGGKASSQATERVLRGLQPHQRAVLRHQPGHQPGGAAGRSRHLAEPRSPGGDRRRVRHGPQ